MSSQEARKRLPVKPSAEHLRKQAKRLTRSATIQLAEAQQRLATDYGCRSWAELMRMVETMNRGADQLQDVRTTVEPLPKAVRARDMAQVRAILASGNFTQHDLDAGLAHAAWYGGGAPEVLTARRALFDLLLDHGADPDGQYGGAYGPIVFGTGECLDPDGLQWLLDAGADVSFPTVETKYGPQCALGSWLGAYARGDNERKHRGIELCLKHGAFIPPEVTPAILAIHRGDAEGLAALLRQDPTLVARAFSDMPYGSILLRGSTLLHCAVEFDEVACIDVLLDHGADINAPSEVIDGIGGQTPVFHVLNTGWGVHHDTLQHLIRRSGSRIDLTVRATWRTSEGTVRAAPVTPLEYADEPGQEGWRKHAEEERALLRSLVDTPLRMAVRAGPAAVARILAEDPPAPDALADALRHACAGNGTERVAVATLLLQAGANPRLEDGDGASPLHHAARLGPLALVELLIRHGAKEWLEDRQRRKPIDHARAGTAIEREAITELLDRPVIRDAVFRQAVSAIHDGDLAGLKRLLSSHPNLVHERAVEPECYPQDYFRDPRLLWFVANNPTLMATMPANSVDLAVAIIDAGAEKRDLDYTLELVMTSLPARQQGLQRPLIRLLLERGASVRPEALVNALGHGELDAARVLLDAGLALTAPVAAGLGITQELPALLSAADQGQRNAALSVAVFNRHLEATRLCLEAGAEVDRPMAIHTHSWPIHQAAINDDVPLLELLVKHGAKLDRRDTLWNGTPLGWTIHAGKAKARAYLESLGAP